MSERSRMLRRNLNLLLPTMEAYDIGIMLEAFGYELQSRRFIGAEILVSYSRLLLDVREGRGPTLQPIYSGDCGDGCRVHRRG